MMYKNRSLRLLLICCCLLFLSLSTYSPTPTNAAPFTIGIPYPPEQEPPSPDIVGGQDAQLGDWPWHAGLVDSGYSNALNGYFCGGALIDEEWVVTAAHCTYDFFSGAPLSPSSVDVVLGRTQLSSNEGQRLGVSQIIRHPLYESSEDNDIALIKLAQPATLDGTVQPIPVVTPAEIALTDPGTVAAVTGWGTTTGWGFFPVDNLKELFIPIVSQQVCQAAFNGEGETITDKMLCAGEDGKDACTWDSGGPLIIPDASQDNYKLAGIVSSGSIPCASPGKYGIYTRVSMFSDWLQSTTGVILFGYQINLPLVIK